MSSDKKDFKQSKDAAKQEAKAAKKARNQGFSGIGDVSSNNGVTFVDGIATMYGGVFDELFIEGVCNCKKDIKAKKIGIEGVFNCDGDIEADQLYCEGTGKISGDVRIKEGVIEGVISLNGRLEADEIKCEGVIQSKGEISADLVYARGAVYAREIVGEKVVIHSRVKLWIRKYILKREVIGLIEASTIELHHVNARVVNGHTIHIGRRCSIERIDCSGTLYIDPTAEVDEIVGNYERVVSLPGSGL